MRPPPARCEEKRGKIIILIRPTSAPSLDLVLTDVWLRVLRETHLIPESGTHKLKIRQHNFADRLCFAPVTSQPSHQSTQPPVDPATSLPSHHRYDSLSRASSVPPTSGLDVLLRI